MNLTTDDKRCYKLESDEKNVYVNLNTQRTRIGESKQFCTPQQQQEKKNKNLIQLSLEIMLSTFFLIEKRLFYVKCFLIVAAQINSRKFPFHCVIGLVIFVS